MLLRNYKSYNIPYVLSKTKKIKCEVLKFVFNKFNKNILIHIYDIFTLAVETAAKLFK